MSFPVIVYGKYGDEKKAQSTAIGSLPIGARLILPDHREYVLAKASTATAISAGFLCCGSVITATGTSLGIGIALAATQAVGDTTLVVTLAAGTAVIANQFQGGYMVIASSAAASGGGQTYKVFSNNSAAAASTVTVTLEPNDPLLTALPGGTSLISLIENPFWNAVVTPASTVFPGAVIGVPQVNLSAGFYGWFQRAGIGAGIVTGTVTVVGDPVTASSTLAGNLQPIPAGSALIWSGRNMNLGQAMVVPSATAGFASINYNLA